MPPGGGPARDGVNMSRNDPLIQQAWYNGLKKLHGTPWLTLQEKLWRTEPCLVAEKVSNGTMGISEECSHY